MQLRAAVRAVGRCVPLVQLLVAAPLATSSPVNPSRGGGAPPPVAVPVSDAPSAPRSCHREAGALQGDPRRAFMKRCLAERNASGVDRNRHCQAKAGQRKGSERASFVRRCNAAPVAG